jgi:hypothetical protein
MPLGARDATLSVDRLPAASDGAAMPDPSE